MRPQHGWPACFQDYRDAMAGTDLPATLTPDQYWRRLSPPEGRALVHALGGMVHVEACEMVTTLFVRFVALEPEKAQLLRDAPGGLSRGHARWPSEQDIDGIMQSWVLRDEKAA